MNDGGDGHGGHGIALRVGDKYRYLPSASEELCLLFPRHAAALRRINSRALALEAGKSPDRPTYITAAALVK